MTLNSVVAEESEKKFWRNRPKAENMKSSMSWLLDLTYDDEIDLSDRLKAEELLIEYYKLEKMSSCGTKSTSQDWKK